jgi:hypothetical protein
LCFGFSTHKQWLNETGIDAEYVGHKRKLVASVVFSLLMLALDALAQLKRGLLVPDTRALKGIL